MTFSEMSLYVPYVLIEFHAIFYVHGLLAVKHVKLD